MNRRRFLGSAAACIGLPVLASWQRGAHATETPRTPRFVAVYTPNGMYMPHWALDGPILEPLEAVREQVDLVSGLYNAAADIDSAGHHACGTAGFLTARRAHRSESRLELGVSLDALVDPAGLVLGLEDGRAYGDCDNGFSCAYSRNISWSGPSSPRPKIVHPHVAFDTLFAGYDPAATSADRIQRKLHRRSVLDAVVDQATDLRRELGRDDTAVLDAYLDDVRDLERRVEAMPPACSTTPPPEPADLDAHASAMLDIIVTAFRCDSARAATLMLANSASDRVYTNLGVTDGHHELSHTAVARGKTGELTAIGAWQVEQFAALLQRLDGAGLLDDTFVLFSSELSNGGRHQHTDLPTLVGGGRASGRGRHLSAADRDWGDLLLTLGQRLGLPLERFGMFGETVLPEL